MYLSHAFYTGWHIPYHRCEAAITLYYNLSLYENHRATPIFCLSVIRVNA
jgi:hypothetical protein